MNTSLRDYPIDDTERIISQVRSRAANRLSGELDARRADENLLWPIELDLNDFVLPFDHLKQDPDYDALCYCAHDIHGSVGRVAAVRHGETHEAPCRSRDCSSSIHLPKAAIDPMEIIYCDGSPDGYLEAVLYYELLYQFPLVFNNYCRQDTILFQKPDAFNESWDPLFEISDWAPKFRGSSLYLYRYDFGGGTAAANRRERIFLCSYDFPQDLFWHQMFGFASSIYQTTLADGNRYTAGRCCCVFSSSAIEIAVQPEGIDDEDEADIEEFEEEPDLPGDSACYIAMQKSLKAGLDKFIDRHPDGVLKAFREALRQDLDHFANGEEISEYDFTVSSRSGNELIYVEFHLEENMMEISKGGSVYDPELGSDSYTDWMFSIWSNGAEESEELRPYQLRIIEGLFDAADAVLSIEAPDKFCYSNGEET